MRFCQYHQPGCLSFAHGTGLEVRETLPDFSILGNLELAAALLGVRKRTYEVVVAAKSAST